MGLGQVGDTPVAVGQVFEQAAPGGVRQRGEGAVQLVGTTFNHLVKC